MKLRDITHVLKVCSSFQVVRQSINTLYVFSSGAKIPFITMQTKSKENNKKMDKNPVFWFPSILLCYDQNMWEIEGISAILNLVGSWAKD